MVPNNGSPSRPSSWRSRSGSWTRTARSGSFGLRASALAAAAGVLLALTVNLGKDVLSTSPALDLADVGRPLFSGCFAASTILFLAATFLAARTARPGELAQVEPEQLIPPLELVRQCVYDVAVEALKAQQHTNARKRRMLTQAGVLFIAASAFLAVGACTVAVTQA
jgi:hypothetical protein